MSYYYDTETGFYYLQSRYYDPTIGRFINADSFASTGQGFLGCNMFAYCNNNPINRTDIGGEVSLWYYLIVDHDFGFIHRTVQAHILANSSIPCKSEVSFLEYGRGDIVSGKAVWEIKHAGKDPIARVLQAYGQASIYVLLNPELEQLGVAGAFCGTFYVSCLDFSYQVNYFTPADGVILYNVSEASNYSGDYDYAYLPKKIKQRKPQLNSYVPSGTVGIYYCAAAVVISAVLSSTGCAKRENYTRG